MACTTVKTPIVYYGGKTSILPHLLEMVPPHENYVEEFVGGGTLFWSKPKAKMETINDRLDVVVNFYRTLKGNYTRLKKMIDATLISRSIYNEAGNILRAHKYGVKVDRLQLAWAFWMQSNFSYMNKILGGYKQEKGGGRSVPSELKNKKREFTHHLVERIENTTIENEDWQVVANARNVKQAFHYFDPTYPGTDRGSLHPMTWEEYEQLVLWCGNECKGKFLLSSYNNDILNRYVKTFGWHKKEITHQLKTARKNGTQTHRTEVLVSNYKSACGTIELFK